MFELKKENSKVEIEMTIDAKTWEEGVQKVYETSKGKFNVEGFRKGHAPRKVIEKTYGDNVFFEDTIEYFVNKTLGEALQAKSNSDVFAIDLGAIVKFTVMVCVPYCEVNPVSWTFAFPPLPTVVPEVEFVEMV